MIEFQLDGAHPEHRVEIEGLIRALCAEFPWVPLKAVRLYDGDEDDRSVTIVCVPRGAANALRARGVPFVDRAPPAAPRAGDVAVAGARFPQ